MLAARLPRSENGEFLRRDVLGTLTISQWQEYAEAHPESTVFHHRAWLELLANHYGMKLHVPALMEGDRVAAALPFLETRRLWGSRRLVALPFTDCIHVLSDGEQVGDRFREALVSADFARFGAVVIRTDRPSRAAGAPSFWVRHTVDTSCGFERLAARVHVTAQQNVRRAQARRLSFECRRDCDGLHDFYRLHVKTRRRLGVPVQRSAFFDRLQSTLLAQNLGFVALVRHGGTPIAAGVFLTYKSMMVYKYVASEPAALEHRPNDFLAWHALRRAAELGFTTFDFGVSRRSQEGLRRFKRKWGAVESNVVNECLLGRMRPPIEDSQAMRWLSMAIRHTPEAFCRAVGAVAYPFSQ